MNKYAKNSFFNQLEQMLLHFKENLRLHLQRKRKNATKAELDRAVNKMMQGIIKPKTSILGQYQAVLSWCLNEFFDDEYQIIKDSFKSLHEEKFHHKIVKSHTRHSKMIAVLQANEKEILKNQQNVMIQWAENIKCYQAIVSDLEKQAKLIIGDKQKMTCLQLYPIVSFEKYQQNAGAVIRAANQLKLPSKLPDYPNLTLGKAELQYEVITHAKIETLMALDNSIQLYRNDLQRESYFISFSKLFSPSRWRRRIALWQYTKSVSSIQDPDHRYTAAELWFKKQKSYFKYKDTNSRFYNKCLLPFQENNEQDYFDQLPETLKRNQRKIKQFQQNIQNGFVTKSKDLAHLKLKFTNLQKYANKLCDCLHGFLDATRKLENCAFGYFVNGASLIQTKIDAVKDCVYQASQEKHLHAAYKILGELAAIQRHAKPNVILALNLRQRVGELSVNKDALALIYAQIDRLINEAIKFGGQANNSNFIGTNLIGLIVREAGNSAQIAKFKELSRSLSEKGRVTYQKNAEQAANDFAQNLDSEIKSGALHTKVVLWRDCYEKHKKMFGKIPDEKSERVYHEKIRIYKAQAKKIHNTAATNLAMLVNKIMQGTLNASALSLERRSKISPYESFKLEHAELLVTIFGTIEQRKRWYHDILPCLSMNLARQPLKISEFGQQTI